MSNLSYLAIGLVGVMCIFAIAIGLNKMARVVVCNYILSIICIGFANMIESISASIMINPNTNPSYNNLKFFLSNSKSGIIVVVYLGLLVWVLTKVRINIDIEKLPIPMPIATIILVVMTMISIVLTLGLSIWGTSFFNGGYVANILSGIVDFSSIQKIVSYLPIIIVTHGLATIYLISEVNNGE